MTWDNFFFQRHRGPDPEQNGKEHPEDVIDMDAVATLYTHLLYTNPQGLVNALQVVSAQCPVVRCPPKPRDVDHVPGVDVHTFLCRDLPPRSVSNLLTRRMASFGYICS